MKINVFGFSFYAEWIVVFGLFANVVLGVGNLFFSLYAMNPISGTVGIFNIIITWLLLGCVEVRKR